MTLYGLLVLLVTFQMFCATKSSMVILNNGGYENIVIAINPRLSEDVKIIENIQNMVKEATGYLFNATKKRLFISSVKILIPLTWSSKAHYTKPKTETYDKADIIIASPFLKYGDEPYTLQYGGCGEPGRYIHLTPDFLLKDSVSKYYGPRGRVFVHEWAHLRWGVFDEYNNDVPYYKAENGKVEATRCSTDIIGTNIKQLCQGASCSSLPCYFDKNTGLYEDGCFFVPEKNQFAHESIMYQQAFSSVSEFCDIINHNTEAPTLQNRVCNSHSTWDVIMNSTDIKSSPPKSDNNIPVPSISLLQYRDRVITLVLDVSGSMGSYDRIGRVYQAVEVFLLKIIETGSYVGIVQFSSTASVLSPLVQIITNEQREKLKSLIPKNANGGTNICSGINTGFQVNKNHDGTTYGTEIILLSDGEDYGVSSCFPSIRDSGATIHIIALGPSAAKELDQIAEMTGGLRFFATDNLDTNSLIDAFSGISSGSGNISQQTIQLESARLNLNPKECLNGTVYIDSSVGNETFFLITWQSAIPTIYLKDPKGKLYTAAQFSNDTTSKSSRLEIPGTAERGPWLYNLCNTNTLNQALGITVTSKAADGNVPPITVNAHMSKDINVHPNPLVVYASVTQGYLPVKGATVTAIIEPGNGDSVTLALLDNGSGADIIKNDGIYSRYFTNFTVNGRYGLKVRVEGSGNKTRLTLPRSRALYIPGFIENGIITMNPSKPIIKDDNLLNVGSFTRTASGDSFLVSNVPAGPIVDIYKPEKVTDLEANMEKNTIVLSWTATGDDLDQGTVSKYVMRMSTTRKNLRDNFNSATSVNISSLKPQPAGSTEIFTFHPENAVPEGTVLYFALVAFDKVSQNSELSNIAQVIFLTPTSPAPTTTNATTIKPPTTHFSTIFLTPTSPAPTTTNATTIKPPTAHFSTTVAQTHTITFPKHTNSKSLNITHLTLIVCAVFITISLIASITVCCSVSCKQKAKDPEM